MYIFQQTGSAASMALVTLLGFLPTLLLSVPAGALADRYDRRLLMMIGDGCSALGIVFILICMLEKIAMTPETKCVETIVVVIATAVIVLANKDMFFETDHVGRLLESTFTEAK